MCETIPTIMVVTLRGHKYIKYVMCIETLVYYNNYKQKHTS